jgi:hypothetical protein
MSLKGKPTPSVPPPLKNTATAPLIYFDTAPIYGVLGGNLQIDIAAQVLVPTSSGSIYSDQVCVAHLRCSHQAALMLMDTLTKALDMHAKTKTNVGIATNGELERSPLLSS